MLLTNVATVCASRMLRQIHFVPFKNDYMYRNCSSFSVYIRWLLFCTFNVLLFHSFESITTRVRQDIPVVAEFFRLLIHMFVAL